eukprot:3384497-Pyramimonas_sp.AAC.1
MDNLISTSTLCLVPSSLACAHCYREICIGALCTRFPCIITNVFVRYNDTNDSIFGFNTHYNVTLYVDGQEVAVNEYNNSLVGGQ